MRRIVVRRPRRGAVLEFERAADPAPGPGRILVRAAAAGVNFADAVVRMGLYEAAKGLDPVVPGFEFSGVVEALGPGAEGYAVGARVFGVTRFGGYAELQSVEPWQLWPCPSGWSDADCAGLPAVFLTAHYGLFQCARVRAGERLLVHSAAGGVGGALLQLAAAAGCPAVAVVGSAAKAGLCRQLGAERVIDRSREDLWRAAAEAAPGGYDVILDSSGVATLREGWKRLAPGGRLVVYGFAEMLPRGRAPGLLGLALKRLSVPRFSPLEMTVANKGVLGFNLAFLFHKRELARAAMAEILGWIAAGKLRPLPVAAYPVERAADAHAALESGTTQGKLVLTF